MKTGTLKELNVKAGDVVQVIGGKSWEIVGIDENGNYLINDPPARHLSNTLPFRIISRAPDTPKAWGEMTDAEKGALLLADHEGKVIEYLSITKEWRTPVDGRSSWSDRESYRVKPEPVREVVTKYYQAGDSVFDTHRITFETVDGKPDCATIKMDPME